MASPVCGDCEGPDQPCAACVADFEYRQALRVSAQLRKLGPDPTVEREVFERVVRELRDDAA